MVDVDGLIKTYMSLAHSIATQVWRTAPHALELDELTGIAYLALCDCANRWAAYCVTPDTPVLTAQLRWVPAGLIEVGDELVGVDEAPPAPYQARRFVASRVLHVGRFVTRCAEISFEDGSTVRCSLDHRWLTRLTAGYHRRAKIFGNTSENQWLETRAIEPGWQILSPLRVWPDDESFEAGWLSGIIDGEGSLCRDPRRITHLGDVGARTITIAQNPGAVLDRVERILTALDIPFRTKPHHGSKTCQIVTISSKRYAIELLGRTRPERFDSHRFWSNSGIWTRSKEFSARTVQTVREIGPAEVAGISTTSRTYLANGLIAHNCDKNNYDPAALQFFKPYVARRVYGALIDANRSADWATRSLRTRAKALQEAGQDKGVPEHELARRSGMTIKEVRQTIHGMSQRPVSLEAEELEPVSGGGVESDAFTADVLNAVVGTIRDLEPELQIVLSLHYFKGLHLQEVARSMGISESRASQFHAKAVLAVHEGMVRAALHQENAA